MVKKKRLNIVLIGFMGTGKTTVGRAIAQKLNFKFVDVDDLIEKTTGMKIGEIFEKFGETRFRDLETEIVKILSKKEGLVISTGGGVVLREENLSNLKKNGILFCLSASVSTIFNRVKDCRNRPLLRVENVEQRIKELLNERIPLYKKADLLIDTEDLKIEEVADKIISEYERLSDGKN